MMDEQYARSYADLARGHWWWQARDALLARTIARWAGVGGDDRVLDVGCGNGRMFPLLERVGEVTGIEPDPHTFGLVPGDPRIHHAPFAAPLPFSGAFDLITLFDVLEHLDDRIGALRLVGGLLRRDGIAIITVPAFQQLWTHHDEVNHHRVRYTMRTLARDVAEAGLATLLSGYRFHALVVPKMIVAFGERLRVLPARLPTVPPVGINSLLRKYFELEQRLPQQLTQFLPGTTVLTVVQRLPA